MRGCRLAGVEVEKLLRGWVARGDPCFLYFRTSMTKRLDWQSAARIGDLRVLRRCIRKMGIVQKIRTRCRFHLGGCAQSGGSGSVIGREPTCAGCLEGRRLRRSDHSTHVKTPIEAP
jgi:hypothetical protein